MPFAQLTKRSVPGHFGKPARRVRGRLRGGRDQNSCARSKLRKVGGGFDGRRQPDARQPVVQASRLERPHVLFAAPAKHDTPARGGGGVGQRRSPGPGADDPDGGLGRHAPVSRIGFSFPD